MAIIVTDPGEGYVSNPQVHLVGGNGSGVTASALVFGGLVENINVANPGSGYTTPPTIQIDPPPSVATPLPGETNTMLTLSPLTKANWTNYFIVITNNYGSVTSTTFGFVVYLPAQILATPNITNNGVQLQFTGTPYYRYILQSATNLTPPVHWQSILTNSTDGSGNWSSTLTNLMSAPGKFYQAIAF